MFLKKVFSIDDCDKFNGLLFINNVLINYVCINNISMIMRLIIN